MKILIACEESQRVCTAFREKGHEAYSCDIIECSGGHPEWHIQGDVLEVLNPKDINCTLPLDPCPTYLQGIQFKTMDGKAHFIDGKWDMIIAHPPCTYMANAGACRLYPKAGLIDAKRLQKAFDAKDFFMKFYTAECEKICIENPMPMKIIGLPKESQRIQPYQFGEPWSKKTYLWLKGLPQLVHTQVLNEYKPFVPSGTGRKLGGDSYGAKNCAHNSKDRSVTFWGIARAMADQWGQK